MTSACAALATVLTFCSPAGRPILAEIYYDAPGDDTGLEFVEIFNPGTMPVPLAGLRLEAGDGAGPGRWSLRWTGAAFDTIAPGGRFVVGGTRVEPRPQAVVTLELQNGPDAIRLTWPDGAGEVLGYGAHDSSEYACGEPAEDVAAGSALARIPDDADHGANAVDFVRSSPSPGRANQPGQDLTWVAGSLAVEPEQPASGEAARIAGLVANRGRQSLAAGEAVVKVRSDAAGVLPLAEVPLTALEAGDTTRVEMALSMLPEGKQTLAARLDWGRDESPENDVDSLRVRVGMGPLEPTEVQFHPAHGEGEWVEVRNRSTMPLDLGTYTLSDRGSARGRPSGGDGPCAPESLALLAQDRAALLQRHPRLDPLRVWQVTPWASLNNSNDAGGIADAVVLRDADGTRCARLDYSAAGIPAGVPIERRAGGDWGPALDPEGSPLIPNPAPAALASHFELTPRRLGPNSRTARIAWSLPWPRARVAVDLYDLAGARVGRAVPEGAVAGRGEREWRNDGLPAGLYLMVMSARSETGGQSLTATRLLRVGGQSP